MKTTIKKLGTLALAFVVVFTGSVVFLNATDGATVYAASKKKCNIVFFGDSTSNGCCMVGYDPSNSAMNKSVPTSQAYPKRITKLLKKSGKYKSVSAKYYNLNGMRYTEIRTLLNSDYHDQIAALESQIQTKYPACQGFNTGHLKEYKDYLTKGDYDKLHNQVVSAVSKANFVVLDNTMMGTGMYFFKRLAGKLFGNIGAGAALSGYSDINFKNTEIDSKIESDSRAFAKELVSKYGGSLLTTLGVSGMIEDEISFCIADTLNSLNNDIKEIRVLNPKTKILVGGTYDIFDKLNISLTGFVNKDIPLDKIFSEINGYVAKYIEKELETKGEYIFVKYKNINTFASAWRKGNVKAKKVKGKYKLTGEKNNVNALKIMVNDRDFGLGMFFGDSKINTIRMARLALMASQNYYNVELDAIGLLSQVDNLYDDLLSNIFKYANGTAAPETIFTKDNALQGLLVNLLGQGAGSHPNLSGVNAKYNAMAKAIKKAMK